MARLKQQRMMFSPQKSDLIGLVDPGRLRYASTLSKPKPVEAAQTHGLHFV
jgi:hypothetical protein